MESPMKIKLSFQRRYAERLGEGKTMKQCVRIVVALAAAGVFAAEPGVAHARFDVPSGGEPSPLFGAAPYSQQLLMFEEFGVQPIQVSNEPYYLPDPGGCMGPANHEDY